MEIPDFMIWVKEEPFLFGLVTATPASRLGTDFLNKLAKYCKGKEGYYPKLNLLQWGHICRYKLKLPTDLSWLYIRMYDIISKIFFEASTENASGSKGDHRKRSDYWDIRCEEIRQCNGSSFEDMNVDTLEFLVFLYLQHYPKLHKKYYTKPTQSSDEPWPTPLPPPVSAAAAGGSPGGGSSSVSPTRRPTGSPTNSKSGTKRKNIPEQVQTEFVEANLEDIINLLKAAIHFGEGISLDSDTIPVEVVKGLSFILSSASNAHDKEFASLEESLFLIPEIGQALELNKALRTVSKSKFVKWVKSNLKLNPWGPSSTPVSQIRANHLSGNWETSKPGQLEMYRAYWNSQPSPKSWYLVSSVDNQVFFLDKVAPFSSLKIHRCNNSFIYAPGAFSSIILEKCQNSTIFLGPAGKVVRISDCDSIRVTAVGRMFNLFDNSRSTFHLLTPCQPVVSGSKNRKLYFAPYNSFYPRLLEDMKAVELGIKIQKWNKPVELGQDGVPLPKNLTQRGGSFLHCNLLRPEKFEEFVFPFKMNGITTKNPMELPVKYSRIWSTVEARKEMLREIVGSKDLSESQLNEFREILNHKFECWLKKQGHYNQIKGLRSIQDSVRAAAAAASMANENNKECSSSRSNKSSSRRRSGVTSSSSEPRSPKETQQQLPNMMLMMSSGGEGPFGPRWASTGADFMSGPINKEVTLSTGSWLSRVSSSSNEARRRLSTASSDLDNDDVFSPVESEDFSNLDCYFTTDEGEDLLDPFEDPVIKLDDGSKWKPF